MLDFAGDFEIKTLAIFVSKNNSWAGKMAQKVKGTVVQAWDPQLES